MPEQFERISDYARQAAVLPDAETLRARGAERQRRRLVVQSTGGVGAVMGVAALIVLVAGGSAPRTAAADEGVPAGSVYVCPASSGNPVAGFQVKTAPSGKGKTVAIPAGCHAVVEPTAAGTWTGTGSGTGTGTYSSAQPSVDLDSPQPIPSGPDWDEVTASSKLPPGATLTLYKQDSSYFLDVRDTKAKEDVIYTLGYDGPAQVMPLLGELGFKHMAEHVVTDVCAYIQTLPHGVMDVRTPDGRSVLGREVTVNTRLTFFDAPASADFPSPDQHGVLTLPASCASPDESGD